MEPTTDLFSIYGIKEDDIKEIVKIQSELVPIRYWRDRQEHFSRRVRELEESTKSLLTFCVWFTMHNIRFKPVLASRYYTIKPSTVNEVDFIDFIKLIHKYNRKVVTATNEIHIIRFLQLCDQQHFEFYLSLISKDFTSTIPTTEVHNLLDLGIIDAEDIYGRIELLQTSFSELSYPVAVMLMQDPDYSLVVHAKEPRRTFSFYQNSGKMRATTDFLTTDKGFINTPRYTLVGYSNPRRIQHRRKTEDILDIYPIDYFDTFLEFRRYRRGSRKKPAVPFKERMLKLKQFLANNYTRQIHKEEIGIAETEKELVHRILELCPDKGAGYLVVTDKDTARTGKAHAIPVVSTYGIIQDIWVDEGVVKGFNLWFNGRLIQCPFEFKGANNSLLNNPELVHQKMLEVTSIRVGDNQIILGKEIQWEKVSWKPYRHKGIICVEKCAMCGGIETPHKRQGICNSCEASFKYYYSVHGTDVWIKETPSIRNKRLNSGWCPEMLTNINVQFKDAYVEARTDGSWRFRYDKERAERYQKFMERTNFGKSNS